MGKRLILLVFTFQMLNWGSFAQPGPVKSVPRYDRIFQLREFKPILREKTTYDAIPAPVIYCHTEESSGPSSPAFIPYVPNQEKEYSSGHRLGSDSGNAKIIVFYNGFSKQAKDAFQHAVDIWSKNLKSTVPIRVFANWAALGPNTLGAAYAGTFRNYGLYRNFPGAPKKDTWYATALAEKLMGRKIN